MARKIKPASDSANKETEAIISKLEKKLKATYSKAYGNAAEKFMVYMTAFQRKDEAHRADVSAGRWSEQEYKDWKRNQLLYGDTLAQIRDTLAADLQKTDKIAIQMVRDKQVDVYALNHNYGTYEIEHGAGVDTSYTLYDHATVERLMKEDPQLLPRPSAKRQREIDAKDLKWNKQHLTSAFTASILAGDDIPTMAKRISSVAQMDQRAAIRNARTMCTGAENGGRADSYQRAKAMGIDVKQQWVATLDNRTRDNHREVDGEIIEVGKKFSNGLRFPGDPQGPAYLVYNCRCTTVAVVNGVNPMAFDKTDTLRRKLGNTEITYQQWKTEHSRRHTIKSVTADTFERIKSIKNSKITDEVIDSTRESLETHNAMSLYDDVKIVRLEPSDRSVYRTNVEKDGFWNTSTLELNETMLGGLTKEQVDELFALASNTVCNSLDDAVTHETYHAKMAEMVSNAEYNALSETESNSKLSDTAGKDALERISEVGVLKERGEYANVDAEDKAAFEQYFPEAKE